MCWHSVTSFNRTCLSHPFLRCDTKSLGACLTNEFEYHLIHTNRNPQKHHWKLALTGHPPQLHLACMRNRCLQSLHNYRAM